MKERKSRRVERVKGVEGVTGVEGVERVKGVLKMVYFLCSRSGEPFGLFDASTLGLFIVQTLGPFRLLNHVTLRPFQFLNARLYTLNSLKMGVQDWSSRSIRFRDCGSSGGG